MAICWYSHHIGDYAKKTPHLTILEHGCYRLLLDYLYSSNGKIPNERSKIYRAIRATNSAERRAVDRILDEFFEVSDEGFLTQGRASEEISKYNKISELRRISGSKCRTNATTNDKQDPPPTTTTTTTTTTNDYKTVPAAAAGATAAAEKKFNGDNLKQLNGEAVSLSDDWVIPDEWGIEIEKLGVFSRDEIVLEGRKFFNHWKSETARPVSAWTKHWRNWFNVAEEKKNGIRNRKKQNYRQAHHG